MKNPFPKLLEADDLRFSGASDPQLFTAEQAEYAAHAINQHEKLVEFCRRVASFGFSFDPRDQANGAYRDAVRWLVQDAAALLKEEKP